uniref:Uncharacterized protein n=1 Tax=Leptobrachium leishanense TaxID=445787 RepID=A0A8C5N3Z0_9ANUR
MASLDLQDEVTCSIYTDIYTDPVTLPCGHSYCRLCITRTWDNQEERDSSCPECRRKLRASVPAVKTCLLCEASLCEIHLRVHSKSEEHVLEYYCCEDAACICVSCSLAGEHRGHQVETLNEASEKKKEKLRNILQKLTSQREEAEKRVQSLDEIRRQVQGKATGVTERVTALIREIRKQLEALEKQVLSEISRQEEQVSLRVSNLIWQLGIKKEELSRKMGDIEELCEITDPVTVLQGRESDTADYCDAEERRDIKVHDAGDLDVGLISVTLHSGLAGIVTRVTRQRRVPEASDMLLDVNTASDMLLDVNTAGNYAYVSGDLKTVSWSEIKLSRPETPERFHDFPQVLSSKSFFSGQHYWEVEVSESEWWEFGMTYPSIERRGKQSGIGDNNKSWLLGKYDDNQYSVRHDSKSIQLPHPPSCRRFGIFLDYEAGRLSFYELCDPIRQLYTFTAVFTEPLHAGFGCNIHILTIIIV